jgi:hypothetical protein
VVRKTKKVKLYPHRPGEALGFQAVEVPRIYRGAGKSLARPGRKQATATEDFDFHISYL